MLAGVAGADRAGSTGGDPAVEPRLGRAAHQFEAMMMKELLAPLSRSSSLFGDESDGDAGVLGEFASESLAGALSAGGGFGIAERIVHSVSRFGNPARTPAVIGKLENDTGISMGE
jgi:Rod binding domain-containing protein